MGFDFYGTDGFFFEEMKETCDACILDLIKEKTGAAKVHAAWRVKTPYRTTPIETLNRVALVSYNNAPTTYLLYGKTYEGFKVIFTWAFKPSDRAIIDKVKSIDIKTEKTTSIRSYDRKSTIMCPVSS